MTTLKVTPQRVDVAGYAGDTLTIQVTVPAGAFDGLEWHAEVRTNRDPSAPVDATFTITEPAVPGDPAYLTLSSQDTARLAQTGAYSGQWDVQVSGPGGVDPVTTLAQGTLTLPLDVTQL